MKSYQTCERLSTVWPLIKHYNALDSQIGSQELNDYTKLFSNYKKIQDANSFSSNYESK